MVGENKRKVEKVASHDGLSSSYSSKPACSNASSFYGNAAQLKPSPVWVEMDWVRKLLSDIT